jgi:hypothetical protein
VIHAHNRTTTASMLGEHIKAINKFAQWERSDPGWVRIVNNDFPVDFAWPIGWLPLRTRMHDDVHPTRVSSTTSHHA